MENKITLEQIQTWINWKKLIQQNPNEFFPKTGENIETYINRLLFDIFNMPNTYNSYGGMPTGGRHLEKYLNHIFRDSINIYMESPTKDIYPYINNKNPSNIERSIRHGINSTWDTISEQVKENFFPYLVANKAPTNLYYILSLYEYICGHFYPFSSEEAKQLESIVNQNPSLMEYATIPKAYEDFQLRFFVRKLMYQQHHQYDTFSHIGASTLLDTILSYINGTAISDNIVEQVKYIRYNKGLLPEYPTNPMIYSGRTYVDPVQTEQRYIRRLFQSMSDTMRQQLFGDSFHPTHFDTYIGHYVTAMVEYVQKVYHK